MKVSKLVTYLIAGGLCIILLIFLVKVAPRLLIASRPMPATQVTPTTMFTKSTPQTMPNVVSVISTPTIASGSINVAASQETTTEIPLCIFDAQAVSQRATLPLNAYTFAEPRVVLTSSTQIELLQWVSETQSLLLLHHPDLSSPQDIIETLNLQTGDRRRYAEAQLTSFEPVWIASEQSVVFVERLSDGKQMMRLSRSITQPIIDLAIDIPGSAVVVDAVHQQVIRLTRTPDQQLQTVSVSYSEPALATKTFSLATLNLQGRPGMDLNPAGTNIAIYGREGFYIQERTTGALCQLDLGQVSADKRWGFWPQWSDDNRYIALITTYGVREGDMVHVTDLMVVDTTTGQKKIIDLGGRNAYRVYWLPETHTLLAIVADENDPNSNYKSLYLIDANTGDFKNIAPGQRFFGIDRLGIEWSPSRKAVFVFCGQVRAMGVEYNEWRICEIATEVKQ